jgi:uncharacterized protein YyaL (SSP411 family)
MSQESMHYIQYLSGIISEERFYEIEEKFNEGLARNLMGAGALAMGSLFGGPSASAQTPPPAAMTKSVDEFGVDDDETVHHDAKQYTKELVAKLRIHRNGFEDKYGREGADLGRMTINKIIKAESSPNGKKVIVTISGMARGTKGSLPGKSEEAIKSLMGQAGSVRVYGVENSGKWMGEVPEDIVSPGSKLYPFTAQVEITGK